MVHHVKPLDCKLRRIAELLSLTISIFTLLAISIVDSFHPSAQQGQAPYMNVELDVEKRLQALVAKDRIRIKEFFVDFDKLRKGWVGEAAVSLF